MRPIENRQQAEGQNERYGNRDDAVCETLGRAAT